MELKKLKNDVEFVQYIDSSLEKNKFGYDRRHKEKDGFDAWIVSGCVYLEIEGIDIKEDSYHKFWISYLGYDEDKNVHHLSAKCFESVHPVDVLVRFIRKYVLVKNDKINIRFDGVFEGTCGDNGGITKASKEPCRYKQGDIGNNRREIKFDADGRCFLHPVSMDKYVKKTSSIFEGIDEKEQLIENIIVENIFNRHRSRFMIVDSGDQVKQNFNYICDNGKWLVCNIRNAEGYNLVRLYAKKEIDLMFENIKSNYHVNKNILKKIEDKAHSFKKDGSMIGIVNSLNAMVSSSDNISRLNYNDLDKIPNDVLLINNKKVPPALFGLYNYKKGLVYRYNKDNRKFFDEMYYTGNCPIVKYDIGEPYNDSAVGVGYMKKLIDSLGGDYLMNQIAYCFIMPQKEVVCMLGQTSTGKTWFFNALNKIFLSNGIYYAVVDELSGRFDSIASAITNHQIVLVDEADELVDRNWNKLLNISGRENLSVETKGIDPRQMSRIGNLITLSNYAPPSISLWGSKMRTRFRRGFVNIVGIPDTYEIERVLKNMKETPERNSVLNSLEDLKSFIADVNSNYAQPFGDLANMNNGVEKIKEIDSALASDDAIKYLTKRVIDSIIDITNNGIHQSRFAKKSDAYWMFFERTNKIYRWALKIDKELPPFVYDGDDLILKNIIP